MKGRALRILFLGEIGHGQTSQMRMHAFERLGHDVRGVHTIEPWTEAGWLARQVQRRRGRGAVVDTINRRVLDAARTHRPDLVWAEKQEYLTPDTLAMLRATGAHLVHFTPDPYFSLAWKRTPVMDAALPLFDTLVYCKRYEQTDYERIGPRTIYMPLGYAEDVHRPLPSSSPQWACQIGFLGGWEPRRESLLGAVASAGADLKIWGGYWNHVRDGRWTPRRHVILNQLAGTDPYRIMRRPALAQTLQGGEVYGDDYARALSGARIGLGLLRTVCPDQHTTRTFEIPACGSLLLADRTDEHQAFFEEGVEADFFSSTEEMLDKIAFYIRNEDVRSRVAMAGIERCRRSKYAYSNRLEMVLDNTLVKTWL